MYYFYTRLSACNYVRQSLLNTDIPVSNILAL